MNFVIQSLITATQFSSKCRMYDVERNFSNALRECYARSGHSTMLFQCFDIDDHCKMRMSTLSAMNLPIWTGQHLTLILIATKDSLRILNLAASIVYLITIEMKSNQMQTYAGNRAKTEPIKTQLEPEEMHSIRNFDQLKSKWPNDWMVIVEIYKGSKKFTF